MTDTGLELVDPARYARDGYPHEVWTRLRSEAPVQWFEPEGYRGFWAITKHADIIEISRQPKLFLNEPRLNLADIEREEANAAGPPLRTIVNMDPPEHGVYRKIANKWFTPRNVAKLEEQMQQSARTLVDKMTAFGDEPYDFVNEVAALHPLRLIASLFGIPPEDEPFVLRITNEIFGATDPEYQREEGVRHSRTSMEEAMGFFAKIMEDRLREPKEDLATVIASAEVDGSPVGAVEVLSYYFVILTAGHDTTRNALAGGLLTLTEHPDQWQALRLDPTLAATAADEIVRWTTPVNHFARTATVDYELRGQTIRAGDSLGLFYSSANRDEEVFEDPFTFRIDRSPNPHLGFGVGEHFCLGASLARMEIRVFLEELIPRLDEVDIVGPPERLATNFVGGIKHLPVQCRVRPGS